MAKKFVNKNIFPIMTKNLNWEISTKNYTALVSVRNGRIFSCRVIP